jgi:hypothetical protein
MFLGAIRAAYRQHSVDAGSSSLVDHTPFIWYDWSLLKWRVCDSATTHHTLTEANPDAVAGAKVEASGLLDGAGVWVP